VREDVGTGRDYKSAATDAFKRAAVRFGIAHELYSYGTNWVELDGDGKFAKPVEDPAAAYARRNSSPKVTPAKRPALALDEETCPKCGGRMWDNRLTKRNPRAPDYKCRDRNCDGVIWPPREGEKKSEPVDAKTSSVSDEWKPLNNAPLIPDSELPF